MYNLVSNAIKHTNNGGRIIIKAFPSTDEGFLTIDVIDNGSGIDPNYISKIFNRFYHHGGNMDRYVNGFGIGLSLTKSLIELHKGSIFVRSEINIGTTFTLNLSFDQNAYTDEEKSDRFLWNNEMPTALSNANYNQDNEVGNNELVVKNPDFNNEKPTILFVDDNKDLIENMAEYFMDNYNIYTAYNGQIGIEMANELQPDIVISDLVMPIMNGIELCETLKRDIKTSHIPIILLTAQGDMNSQFEGVKSGEDYFVPKPFNIKILNLTIKNIIESRNKFKNLFLTNKYEDAGDLTTNSKDKEFIEKYQEKALKVWKDYIKEHHNEYIKESLEGVDDEDVDDARKDLFDFIQNDVTNKFGYRIDDDHPHAVDQYIKEDQDAFGDLLYELIGSSNIDKDSGIRKKIK